MSALAATAGSVRASILSPAALRFALRNWATMMVALYAAFWLQLDGASSAATCVAILSLQTRGQAFQKAGYRLLGTAIGVAASLAIAGALGQTRELFLVACCIWFGLCAALAGLLDGNRAYGAILSGYTVGIVALPNVDAPLRTFSSGVNQGAAITIGILAVALVSDLTLAPDLYPVVLKRLTDARAKARSFAIETLRGGAVAGVGEAAALFRDITSMHADMTALPAETLRGGTRYRAASLAASGLLRSISAAHVVATALAALGEVGEDARADLARELQGRSHRPNRTRALALLAAPDTPPRQLIAASACLALLDQSRAADVALAAMRDGRPVTSAAPVAPWRSSRAALRTGLRSGLSLAIASFALSRLDWPASTTALVQVATLTGLSSTSPNARGFASAALVAIPLAVAATGVTEFLVLDGVDQFPLLALGMAPVILVASFMLAAGKPALYGIGFLLLVYFTVILSPANPQGYDPQTFLFSSFLSILAATALFVLQSTLLPTDDARRRTWILASARDDLRDALSGRGRRYGASAGAFRDADRVAQLGTLRGLRDRDGDLRRVLRMSTLAGCVRRIGMGFAADHGLRGFAVRTSQALAALEPRRLRGLGRELLIAGGDADDGRGGARAGIAADLFLAATLIEHGSDLLGEIRKGAAR